MPLASRPLAKNSASTSRRETARAIYDSIQNAGGSAALLTQERENVFTQKLANLDAGEKATVYISLSMPLDYLDGVFELAFPTMVASRCCNAGTAPLYGTLTGWNPPANVDGPSIQFNVAIQSGSALKNISSPTHPIELFSASAKMDLMVERGALPDANSLELGNKHIVLLQELETYPNKDFVLRFERNESHSDLSVATWSPDEKSDRHFMLHLFPDPVLAGKSDASVDAMLLIDISGSQSGWPLDYEKKSALAMLEQLDENDRLCVMAFETSHSFAFADTLRPATAANIAIARKFIERLTAVGGTELFSAMQALMKIPNPDNHHRLNVLFTDGFITNDTEILSYLSNLDPAPQMITLGAGDNINRSFLDAAAEIGDGFSTVFTYGEDPSTLGYSAWTRVTSPQIKDLSLSFSSGSFYDLIQPSGNALYSGMPYRAYGRTSAKGPVTVTLSGLSGTTPVSYSKTIDFGTTGAGGWVVPKLWAKANIHQLELAEGTSNSNQDTIIDVSLEHQVLSKYTAFLAYDETSPEEDAFYTRALENPGNRINGVSGNTILQTTPISHGFRFEWDGYLTPKTIRIFDLRGHLIAEYSPDGTETCWNFLTEGMLGQRLILQVISKYGVQNSVLPPLS